MLTPQIEFIHIAPKATAPMTSVESCLCHPGKGIIGDRYESASGTFSNWPKDHELTLVEGEVFDQLRTLNFPLSPGDTRRNLTTRHIRLNPLVGQVFLIGQVRCIGTRLCEPCAHLEKLLNMPGLVAAMTNRGGLRAKILDAGEIQIGSVIRLA